MLGIFIDIGTLVLVVEGNDIYDFLGTLDAEESDYET